MAQRKLLFDCRNIPQDKIDFVAETFQQLCSKEKIILLMKGDVGAGKTTFLAAWSKKLNLPQVQSPTYAFHHQYTSPQNVQLDHFDLYRIKDESDLDSIGFWDLLDSAGLQVVIEWFEKIENINWNTVVKGRRVYEIEIKSTDESSSEFSNGRDYFLFSIE